MPLTRPLVALAAAGAVCAGLATTAWFKENGYADVTRLTEAIASVEARTGELKEENSRLSARLARITTDEGYVEAVARESLGLVRPGEMVFEFVDEGLLARSPAPADAGTK
ncbi:MAG: septum formation initiator family protein [Nitrospinae bacterium]|nr:septum formation initiator family protein [Nitrospinota bacterium]